MSAAARAGSGQRIWLLAFLSSLALLLAGLSAPAVAHRQQQHNQAQTQASPGVASSGAMPANMAAGHGQMGDMTGEMDMTVDRSKMSFLKRLFGWLGRIHPLLVHFPIAFFPAALLTAIAGRRRPAFAAPVQFLVVAGAIFAPLAAGAGWLAGMTADPEPILTYHRWLGVAIAIAGAGIGIWAWRRPWEDRGAGMIAALTIMTIAIAVQGFLGAGLTHGMDHMMF